GEREHRCRREARVVSERAGGEREVLPESHEYLPVSTPGGAIGLAANPLPCGAIVRPDSARSKKSQPGGTIHARFAPYMLTAVSQGRRKRKTINMKMRSKIKAGGIRMNHNQTGSVPVRSRVRAGGI